MTEWGELKTALMFFGGLFIFFALLPKKVYYDAHEAHTKNPQNYTVCADFENGYWQNGTWIPNDYWLRVKDKRYSFAKGEVTHFDYTTGRWYLYDGNYAEIKGGVELAEEATDHVQYLKKWGFQFEIIGKVAEYKMVKQSWFSGWYED